MLIHLLDGGCFLLHFLELLLFFRLGWFFIKRGVLFYYLTLKSILGSNPLEIRDYRLAF